MNSVALTFPIREINNLTHIEIESPSIHKRVALEEVPLAVNNLVIEKEEGDIFWPGPTHSFGHLTLVY